MIGQASDGEEAIQMVRELRPDLMIVDVSMPKANGVQVTATVTRESPETRVIGLSMHEQEDMANAMRDAGAVGYFAKSGSGGDSAGNVSRRGCTGHSVMRSKKTKTGSTLWRCPLTTLHQPHIGGWCCLANRPEACQTGFDDRSRPRI